MLNTTCNSKSKIRNRERFTIGIIGGNGQMGRLFNRLFSEAGHRVLVSDIKTALSSKDLAKQSDIVLLSVPIDTAISLSEEIGPILSKDQLLMDICSQKTSILKAMLRFTSAQVIGTHPLFGPFTNSIRGHNIIVCPGRGNSWLKWLEDELQTKGAVVTKMDSMTHDKNMAVVQGLTHILTVCMGRMLQKINMTPDDALLFSTPVFRINLDLIGRLLAQDLDLYEGLIAKNNYVQEIFEMFLSVLDEGRGQLLSGKPGDGAAFMGEIRDFFGTFCQESLVESNKMINALYSDASLTSTRDE